MAALNATLKRAMRGLFVVVSLSVANLVELWVRWHDAASNSGCDVMMLPPTLGAMP